jgi:acetylornithine deacetylase
MDLNNSIDWLKKLISFDTTSRHSNLSLISTIADFLSTQDILITLTYDETRQKANLFATLPAKNGEINDGIVLSGHTDVVPVDGQKWDTDPFNAIVIKDRLYGRGASDMKGFIAVILALIPQFKQMSLSKPIHFAFSYDEEVGCLGVPHLIADMKQKGILPSACIVGEPSEMKPIVAHKGINAFRCHVHGSAAHSSLVPNGCNAIEYAAQLIVWIRQYSEELKNMGQDVLYDVAHTTITTNLISGGKALNIIPEFCEFLFEFRNLPTSDSYSIIEKIQSYVKNNLIPQMKKENPSAGITINAIGSVPGHEVSEEAEITKLVRSVTNEPTIRKVSYATEAGLFQQAGIPTIICGPGSIKQAHIANEYIELTQLTQCELFLNNLVKHFSS